jgi:K+/H+ antiporter YhaU regulatory subunit KhtT
MVGYYKTTEQLKQTLLKAVELTEREIEEVDDVEEKQRLQDDIRRVKNKVHKLKEIWK